MRDLTSATPAVPERDGEETVRLEAEALLAWLDLWAWTCHRKADSPDISANVALDELNERRDNLRKALSARPTPEGEDARREFVEDVRRFFDPLRHEAIRDDAAYWRSERESEALAKRIRDYLARIPASTPTRSERDA